MNLTKLDLIAELSDAVLMFFERAKRDDIELIYDEPMDIMPIQADSNRLRQVFINIIDNAIKYSDSGDSVTVAAQIVNLDYQPCFASTSAVSLTQDEIKEIGKQPVQQDNTILHAKPIKAGFVVWQDDVTEINKLTEQLQEVQKQLGRKNALLQAELKLKEQQAQLEEKNHLYNRITEEVAPQIEKIEDLLEQTKNPQLAESALVKMCVIGSYVKRRSNLLLLGEENPIVQAREIEYCIRESLDNLQLASVSVLLNAKCEGDIPLTCLIAAYDFYEGLVEMLFDQITAMMVRITCKDGSLRMNLQIGCTSSMEKSVLDAICVHDSKFTYTVQEEDIVIDYEIAEGGADK